MKILRVALGVLIGAYGVFCLFPIVTNAVYKAGRMPDPTGEAARMIPLWQATSWWELAAWTGIVALFVVIGARLMRGQTAFGLYLIALGADAGLWWIMHASEAYQRAFTQAELQLDYVMLAAMVVVALLIWIAERRPAPHPASA
jgi:hypothetical protein